MDTKISSDFWSKPCIEAVSRDVRYAALWLLTNDRISLCGHAIVSARRFAFETGLPEEIFAEAILALPDTFTPISGGYWARGYIRRQFGHGSALARSNMSQAVVNALHDAPAEVVALVLMEYPELAERFRPSSPPTASTSKPTDTPSEALGNPLSTPPRVAPSPTQGQRVREGERERAGEDPARAREANAPPDPIFEALASATGHDIAQLTSAARGGLNAARKQIGLATPGVTAAEVNRRAECYRLQHPTWALTPSSLAKHWPTLDGKAGQRRNGNRVAEIVEPDFWREYLRDHMAHVRWVIDLGDLAKARFADINPLYRAALVESLKKAS